MGRRGGGPGALRSPTEGRGLPAQRMRLRCHRGRRARALRRRPGGAATERERRNVDAQAAERRADAADHAGDVDIARKQQRAFERRFERRCRRARGCAASRLARPCLRSRIRGRHRHRRRPLRSCSDIRARAAAWFPGSSIPRAAASSDTFTRFTFSSRTALSAPTITALRITCEPISAGSPAYRMRTRREAARRRGLRDERSQPLAQFEIWPQPAVLLRRERGHVDGVADQCRRRG